MFFGLKRPYAMFKWLGMLFGFGFLFRKKLSEADRTELRRKARTFRHKLNEALDIWDDEKDEKPVSEAE